MTTQERKPWVTRWGHDDHSWNIDAPDEGEVIDSDGSGNPGRFLVGCAVGRWQLTQAEVATAQAIAAQFNLPLSMAEDVLADIDEFETTSLHDAVGTWSALVGGSASVAEAAAVFQLAPAVIVDAFDGLDSYFLYLSGDRSDPERLMIEHDGE